MEKKILIANILCIVFTILLGYLILFETAVEFPQPVSPNEIVPLDIPEATEYNPGVAAGSDRFPQLGKVAIIRTLYTPTPTPTPRPVTPTPAPELSKILQDWALLGIVGGECVLENRKTREELTGKAGDVLTMSYRNNEVEVTIKELNQDEDYVVFEAYGKNKKVGLF